ncbi:MAG TPA: translation initiation factor IF-3, partial [Candidatus Marinimicrobia bacterium]|nr:translation initiation factor IF-3 [Candidatus Neomarinimicrobiota bacterium]
MKEIAKIEKIRVNSKIRAEEVLVITDKGVQLGVMPTLKAIEEAESAGLDLVEVAPKAKPPVCRLMDYG